MKFNPNYTINHGLLNDIVEINKLIIELDMEKIPNNIYSEILHETNQVSTYQAFSMFSEEITLKKVRQALSKKLKERDNLEKQIANYHNVIINLNKFKKKNFDIELARIIYKELMQGVDVDVSVDSKTNFRKENAVFKNPQTGNINYSAPHRKDILNLMKDLFKFANQQDINLLVKAGIFHKQFNIIHPFPYSNGQVSRILTRILLSRIELNFFNLLNLESHYKQNPKKYFDEVGVMGNYYAVQNKIDFTLWLEYFVQGILEELRKLKKQISKQKTEIRTKISKDQKKILSYIQKNASIDDSEYSKLTDRKKSTRVVDFNKLIEMGLIERKGKARQTFYTLK